MPNPRSPESEPDAPPPPVVLEPGTEHLASQVYKDWEAKEWTKDDLKQAAKKPDDFDKLVFDSPYGKEIDAREFRHLDEDNDKTLSMTELEKGRRSGNFDEKTVEAIDGLQKLIKDNPAPIALSFGDKVFATYHSVAKDGVVDKAEILADAAPILDRHSKAAAARIDHGNQYLAIDDFRRMASALKGVDTSMQEIQDRVNSQLKDMGSKHSISVIDRNDPLAPKKLPSNFQGVDTLIVLDRSRTVTKSSPEAAKWGRFIMGVNRNEKTEK